MTTGVASADRILEEIYTENPLRAHIAANYLIEMRASLAEVTRVLKQGGYFVLVAANNQVCGRVFETQAYLAQIVESFGFCRLLQIVDGIPSRGLMTKRNKTAGVISNEWISVFRKQLGSKSWRRVS